MINAILLILSPGPTWKRLASANRSPVWVILLYLLPILVITCGVEAWSLTTYGTQEVSIQKMQKVSLDLAMRYATTHVVLGMASVFLCAYMVHAIVGGIHTRHNFSQCLNISAYALGSAYLLRIADAWDFLNTWVVLAAAVFIIFSVLYAGVPQIIKPDPAKAFGLYLTVAVMLAVCHGATHLFAFLVLKERLFKGGFGLGILGF
jgi:hypothetical protein